MWHSYLSQSIPRLAISLSPEDGKVISLFSVSPSLFAQQGRDSSISRGQLKTKSAAYEMLPSRVSEKHRTSAAP